MIPDNVVVPSPSLADARLAALLQVADDELFVGHILTSQAGWGPELEVNLVLSSLGQEALGHARVFYSLVFGDDRDRINDAIYRRPAADFRSSLLAECYVEEWEAMVVKHFLYDTADQARLSALVAAEVLDPTIRDRVEAEEVFQRDFWSAWVTQIASSGESGRARVQAAIDRLWFLSTSMFRLEDSDGAEAGAGARDADVGRELDAALRSWTSDVATQLGRLQLRLPDDADHRALTARDDRNRVLSELRFVHDEAPGKMVNTQDLSAAIRDAVAKVEDPELPVSIEQLGMLVGVEVLESEPGIDVVVHLRPTYLGCPARFLIERDIAERVQTIVAAWSVRVEWDMATPWQAAHVTVQGRRRLEEHGVILDDGGTMRCPFCGSERLVILSERGGSLCRRLASCADCRTTVDIMGPTSTRAVAVGIVRRPTLTRSDNPPNMLDHAVGDDLVQERV